MTPKRKTLIARRADTTACERATVDGERDANPLAIDPNSRVNKPGKPVTACTPIASPLKGNGHGEFGPTSDKCTIEIGANEKDSPPQVELLPGAFEPSDQFYRVVKKETPPVFPKRSFIDAAAATNSGEQKVAEFHRNLFFSDEARSAKDKVLRQTIADVQDNIASGEAHEALRKADLSRTERDLYEDTKPEKHWRLSTKLMVAAMFVLAAVYVAAEVRNGMVFCLMSGRELLQNPLMALFISLVPCTATGVFLKLLDHQFHTDRARWLFKFVLAVVGLVAGVAAIPLFASTYAEFLRDPVEAMTNGTVRGFSPAMMIGLQMFLCSLSAAALVIFAYATIAEHRGPVRRDNPSWLKIKRDLDQTSRVLRKDRELLGFAQGKLDALTAELNILVDLAVAAYRLARQTCELTEQRARQSAATLDLMLPPAN